MTLAEAPPVAVSPVSDRRRADYESNGYLCLPEFVGPEWLAELRAVTAEFIEASRAETASGKVFDLEPTHTADAPRLRRLNSPVDQHPTYARFTFEGPPAQLASALLGGPVRYHHSKLNFKWSDGGEEVKWHQDIQFWPHTDFTPLTIGVYLFDVDPDMAPMGVLPGSHLGPLYDLYAPDGNWAGAMSDDDAAGLDIDAMEYLGGPAGSVTVHNCCMVHGSMPNNSPRPRPLLLQTYSAHRLLPHLPRRCERRAGRKAAAASAAASLPRCSPSMAVRCTGRPTGHARDRRRSSAPSRRTTESLQGRMRRRREVRPDMSDDRQHVLPDLRRRS